MSRFDRLEVHPHGTAQPEERPAGPPSAEPERDERFYCEQATLAFHKGDAERALRLFSRALGLSPADATAWIGQLRSLFLLGEFKEAVLWSDRALAALPDHPDVLALKAAALGRTAEYDRAVALSDATIKAQKEGSWLIWWARGDLLLATVFDKAGFCFEKAKEVATQPVVAHLEIGRSYLSAGYLPEAMAELREADRLDPNNPATLYYLALALSLAGKRREALDEIDRCLRYQPHAAIREEVSGLRDVVAKAFFVRAAARKFVKQAKREGA